MGGPRVQEALWEAFLEARADSPSIKAAAEKVGISYAAVMTRKKVDDDFAELLEAASQEWRDHLKQLYFQDAFVGAEEYVLCGNKVATDTDGQPLMQRKRSDAAKRILASLEFGPSASAFGDTVAEKMNRHGNKDIAATIGGDTDPESIDVGTKAKRRTVKTTAAPLPD